LEDDEDLLAQIPKVKICGQHVISSNNSEIKFSKRKGVESELKYDVVSVSYKTDNSKYFLCIKGPEGT